MPLERATVKLVCEPTGRYRTKNAPRQFVRILPGVLINGEIHPDLPRDPTHTVDKHKYITYHLHVVSRRRKITGMILRVVQYGTSVLKATAVA